MKDVNELRDDELAEVTGGGSGSLPQNGITFERYSSLEAGFYYSSAQDTSNVVYVYSCPSGLGYTRESFTVDPSNNSWISKNITPSGVRHENFNIAGFMELYPFRLNVQP